MADVGYEDFSAAANRMLAAKKAGQPENPVDRQIFEQGDPIHGQQFYKDYAAARSDGNIPIEDWKADPGIGPHTTARLGIGLGAMPFDLGAQAIDALANVGRKITGGEPVTPTPLPSTMLKNAIGVPEAPPGQAPYETGATLVAGALPAAGAAAANAAPGVINAARAVGGSLFKNAVVAPALSTGAAAASDALGGGDTARFFAGTLGALAPSTVLSPSAWRGVQAFLTQQKYVDPRAGAIATAMEKLGLTPSYGSMATDRGKALEASVAPGAVADRNRAMGAALEDMGNKLFEQRRALPPSTPDTAPYVTAAEQARTAAANQPAYTGPPPSASSAAQEQLLTNVGPRSLVDVGNTINEANRAASTVSSAAGKPVIARAQSLQADAVPAPPNFVGPTRPQVPFEQVLNWRSNLGRDYENLPALKGRPLGMVYPSVTGDLRAGAAASPGQVPPAGFDAAMKISRDEAAANELNASLRKTLGKSTATGERNFAQKVDDLSQPGMEHEYGQFSGQPRPGQPPDPNDISSQLANLALVSEKAYQSPVQGGGSEAGGRLVKSSAIPILGGIGTTVLHGMGLGPVAASIPAVASAIPAAARAVGSGLMQSPNVLNVMRGTQPRTPYAQMPSMQDLIAALNAAQVGQRVMR